jgi:hypothetical protein
MSTLPNRFSLITDPALASLRSLVGVPIEDTIEPWCYEATRDNIRHWAHGIGDDNPLWCHPAYATATPHGRLIAPPSFLFPLNRRNDYSAPLSSNDEMRVIAKLLRGKS